MQNIFDKIDRIRRIEGWNQDDLAQKLGVSRTALYRWQNDPDVRIRQSNLRILQRFLEEYERAHASISRPIHFPLQEFLTQVSDGVKQIERYSEDSPLEFDHAAYTKILEISDRIARAARLIHAAHSASIFQKPPLPMVAETPAEYKPKKKPAP